MTNERVRFAIIAENYKHDQDAGIPPHLIVPDDKRRYSVKAILTKIECEELLYFIKGCDINPNDFVITSALAKVVEALGVHGFEAPDE